LKSLLLLALIPLACLQISACAAVAGGEPDGSVLQGRLDEETASYFPLSVGNRWRYRCSVEGEHAFDKTISITGSELVQGVRYFRAELRVGDDPVPLETFYYEDGQGGIRFSVEKSQEQNTLLITANPSVGDSLGDLVISSEQEVETPVTGLIKALLVEKYSLDDPHLSGKQRMDWEGKFYTLGIGLVIEADGLGGECVLVEFSHGAN
jgi:hypothetical protein